MLGIWRWVSSVCGTSARGTRCGLRALGRRRAVSTVTTASDGVRMPDGSQWRRRRATSAYRGPDRRGLIAPDRPAPVAASGGGLLAGVVAAPILASLAAAWCGADLRGWTTGMVDVGVLGYVVAVVLLVLRWRLVGDARCVPLAVVAAIVGLVLVPATAHDAGAGRLVAGLRCGGLLLVVAMLWRAWRDPEVRADLRPAVPIAGAAAAVVAGGMVIAASPLGGLAVVHGDRTSPLLAALSSAVAVGGLVVVAASLRRRHLLLTASATSVMAAGTAEAVRALLPGAPARTMAVMLLLAGGAALVVVVGSELRAALHAVVLHDVRGRRRWEAAERQLTDVRSTVQGRRHDVRSMLGAIDGTLMVLATHRHRLPAHEVDQLVRALRDEVHLLQGLVGSELGTKCYDVTQLLAAVVSVRAASDQSFHFDALPGLQALGRPDRLAVAVDNLLANVAVHAAGATVRVGAIGVHTPTGVVVVVTVADDGPGLAPEELHHALERGWRGRAAIGRAGSGLGLAQCAELIRAEGGEVSACATDPAAPQGHRGLTVRLTVPGAGPGAGAAWTGAPEPVAAFAETQGRRT